MQQMQGGALGIVFKIFAIILAFSLGVAVGGQPITRHDDYQYEGIQIYDIAKWLAEY